MEIFLVGSVILNIVLGFALVVTKTKLKEKKKNTII